MHRSEREAALAGVRFSRGSCDRGGNPLACAYGRRGPPRYGPKNGAFHRRARACPSPCLDRGNGVGLRSFFARVVRSRGTGPRATGLRTVPFTVGRGPVPRHASIGETALVGVRFSRGSSDHGGQAPALRARKGFSSPCAVRNQASPNYSFLRLILVNHDNRDNPAPIV